MQLTLRQFIIAAVRQGCREKVAHGEIIGWKGPAKVHYLLKPQPEGDLIAILPNVRESETLSPTVLTNLVRALDLTGFELSNGGVAT